MDWQVVAGVLSIFAVVIPIAVAVYERSVKRLGYEVLGVARLLGQSAIGQKVEIYFDGARVDDPALAEVRFKNTGNTSVLAEDFERPITFGFGPDATILQAEVSEARPAILRPGISVRGSNISVQPTLLNSGDSFVIKALVDRPTDLISLDYRIRGVKELRRSTRQIRLTTRVFVAGVGAVVAYGVSFLLLPIVGFRNPDLFSGVFAGSLIGIVISIFVDPFARQPRPSLRDRGNSSVAPATHGVPPDASIQWDSALIDPGLVSSPTTREEAPARHAQPVSKWLPIPGELGSLALSNDDLDRALERGRQKAKQEIADDVELDFAFLTLLPEPQLIVAGVSRVAMKEFQLTITEISESLYAVKRLGSYPEIDVSEFVPDPWRVNQGWRTLVEKSWLQVRPFRGDAKLKARPGPGVLWCLEYESRGDLWETTAFGLVANEVVRTPDCYEELG